VPTAAAGLGGGTVPKFEQITPILRVRDVEASIAYYTKRLGFTDLLAVRGAAELRGREPGRARGPVLPRLPGQPRDVAEHLGGRRGCPPC
jgi:catechol 2,3-dioxygenase-like lactoylglutathione lyase family enzyme